MELVQDLCVTAVIAVLFSFLIAKLVSMAMAGDSSQDSQSTPSKNVGQEITWDVDEQIIMEELQFRERLEVEGFKTEKKAEFVEEVTEKVEFVRESVPVEEVVESVNQNEIIDSELAQKSIEEEKLVEEVLEKKGGEFEEKEATSDGWFKEDRGSEELAVDNNDIIVGEESEEVRVVASDSKEEIEEKKVEIDVDGEDDWEGIERSELEKVFAEAAKFVESKDKDERLGSDVQMELYGLHKVATEGPCHEQPPMALMFSARAKCDGGHWLRCARNAWQRLGNMSPEVAMEQYIALVSDRFPEWMEEKPIGDGKPEPSEAENRGAVAPALSTFSSYQPNITDERNPELKPEAEKSNLTGGSNLETEPKNDVHCSAA